MEKETFMGVKQSLGKEIKTKKKKRRQPRKLRREERREAVELTPLTFLIGASAYHMHRKINRRRS